MKPITHYIKWANAITTLNYLLGMIIILIAMNQAIYLAVALWMLTPIGDAVDGMIARRSQRDVSQIQFGFTIDSLCDLLNFGIVPTLVLYQAGFNHSYQLPFLLLLSGAALWRLSYFAANDGDEKAYTGMPSTYIPFFLAAAFLLRAYNTTLFHGTLYILIPLISYFMLSTIKFKDPTPAGNILLLLYLTAMFVCFFLLIS